MNFFIFFTTLNYQLVHSTAIQLKTLYPDSRFAGIISAHGDVKGFFAKQSEIEYESLHEITNIESAFLKEDIPFEELREFEETLPEKSLWRLIAVDRKWGYQFSKGALPLALQSKKEVNRDNALRVAGGYVRFFKKVLSEFNADVVLFKLGSHSMAVLILEQICKNMNIFHLAPVATRVQNYFAITTNKDTTLYQIRNTYEKIIQGQLRIDSSPGEKCYYEMLAALNKQNTTYYYDQGDLLVEELKPAKQSNLIVSSLKSIIGTTLEWKNVRNLERNKERGLDETDAMMEKSRFPLKSLFYKYYYNLRHLYQKKKAFDKSFYDEFDFNEKYLYFPLQVVPEYTLQVQANIWINQLHTIEVLAKSIPFDWKIYVKEHPAQVLYRVRPFSFYKELKAYPNVKLIPFYVDKHQITKNCQLIVTKTGTVGWEAILFYGRPVINLTEAFYDVTQLSERVFSLLDIGKEIHEAYRRINRIPQEERKKRLICLLNAVILHSFWVDTPLSFVGDDPTPPSEEDVWKMGKVLGRAIKKYLDEATISEPIPI